MTFLNNYQIKNQLKIDRNVVLKLFIVLRKTKLDIFVIQLINVNKQRQLKQSKSRVRMVVERNMQ